MKVINEMRQFENECEGEGEDEDEDEDEVMNVCVLSSFKRFVNWSYVILLI